MKIYYFILTLFLCNISFAQTSISGSVKDTKNQAVPGVNVRVVGQKSGTTTDFEGRFNLKSTQSVPFTVEATSVGFESQKITVTENRQVVNFILASEDTKLDEIVVSASRTPERVVESPVTIERMSTLQIKNTTAATFYDGLENLKEVQMNTSSLSFKSINTRGFATVANTRFLQLVDGMDNASPALNFVLGNLIGVSELDIANVELLPGASSALYGANAFNGVLFMNSKSPFAKEGISTYFKYGQTSQQTAGTNDYYDFGLRAAKAFSKHFALKGNFVFTKATEWIASETTSLTGGTIGKPGNQNYDGLNLYGDEVTNFIAPVGQISRTGYREQDLNDNKLQNIKADFSMHIKPWANDFEIILQEKIGQGNTVYQGANRYALKNFLMNQVKLEVKGKNFFARIYNTTEDAGNSYDMRFAAWNINRLAKSDVNWFTDYAKAFQLSQAILLYGSDQAAAYARTFADTNVSPGLPTALLSPNNGGGPNGVRLEPGTQAFADALKNVSGIPDFTKGAKFKDQSSIWHSDVNYNFKNEIKFAEFQVGGSARQYTLNSEGSIFTDKDGPIKYREYGVYGQVQKKFMDDRLKFTGSVRYDKAQNFVGNFSPRVSFVYSAGASKKHNFRVSYQTGFRNPTTQDQYIGLDLGPVALIGSASDNLSRFSEIRGGGGNGGFISAQGQTILGASTITLTGQDAYSNALTQPSVLAYDLARRAGQSVAQASTLLQSTTVGLVKPESVQAFELGYRSVINNDLSVDINGYYNIYNDFLSQARVYTPYYGNVFASLSPTSDAVTAIENKDRRLYQIYTNSKTQVTSVGFGVGLSKKVYGNFELGVNYNYADFKFDQEKDPAFIPGFNTPKHRVKASLGNTKLLKNLGFNANMRWSDKYLWESSFADGIVPAVTVFDAQINYGIPQLKSVLKFGANNIGGKDYIQVIGAGRIGQQWFASLTINP